MIRVAWRFLTLNVHLLTNERHPRAKLDAQSFIKTQQNCNDGSLKSRYEHSHDQPTFGDNFPWPHRRVGSHLSRRRRYPAKVPDAPDFR